MKGKYATIGEPENDLNDEMACQMSKFQVNIKLFQGWAHRKNFPYKDIFQYQ